MKTTSKSNSLARAATLIAAGNVTSRLLGLGREIVIAHFFGATGLVSAFRIAQQVPTMLYDLLVGGMVSSAFVPLFSEQAEQDRAQLWHLASLILSLVTVLMVVVVVAIELAAPQVTLLMAGGFTSDLLGVTTHLLRITTLAVIFLGWSGVITGLLQSLHRFALPAFTAAVFNATIIMTALAGVYLFNWGIEALATGLLLGAVLQLLLQLPGLRDGRLRFVLDYHHPSLWRVGKLGLPIILGLVISQIAITFDRNLASRTGEQSIAWMQNATTIIQFPLGLVSTAISMAILPTLSRLAPQAPPPPLRKRGELPSTFEGEGPGVVQLRLSEFMETLALGLRLVLILIIPATVALFIMAEPIVALLLERGHFTPYDTQQTAIALRFYLFGLIFAAIDQPLIFAYYARQNTLTPALVGLLGVGFYLLAALSPSFILARPMHMTDLVFANSVQLSGHALVMLGLVNRFSSLRGRGIGVATGKAIIAVGVMGFLLSGLLEPLQNLLSPHSFSNRAMLVIILTGLGGATYFLMLAILRTQELSMIFNLFRRIGQKIVK